jgi:hypothetical protein
MGSDPNVTHRTEFVWRRLMEPIQVFGKEYDGRWWLAILIPILLAAAVYVVFMYLRDGRSIGWVWGTFLAGLRIAVYGLLTVLFLMPAMQVLDESITRFKVLLLFDVSGSMHNKDDLPNEAVPVEKMLSRQDKIINYLSTDQLAFLKRLQKNPVSLYRYGGVVDPEFRDLDKELTTENATLTKDELITWLKPEAHPKVAIGETDEEKAAARKKVELHALLVNGTNIADSILTVMKKEANNQPQGIVIFSDGRSTQFSTQAVEEVRKSKIPVFTVGVGDFRQPKSIRITELLVPEQVLPDMPFPVRVEVDGEGLADQEVPVTLAIYKPLGENDKEDENRKPDLELVEKIRFKPGDPPHGQAEFLMDPAKLPAEFRKSEATSKPELLEGKWKFVVRIPRDKQEIFQAKEHVSDPEYVIVVKKPLRVLLFAGGPTRDYQFLRTLLVRETDQKRAELSICLQNSRPEIVQDVPEERMLKEFPTRLSDADDPDEKVEDKYMNLMQYDVIVCFDPDWTKLTTEQMGRLEKWVDRYRGGLVVVGGPVNTVQLTRGINLEKVQPLLHMLPVVLEDNRIKSIDRSTSEPCRLEFPGVTSDMEFMKLDEENTDKNPVAGWEEYFFGGGKNDGRGLLRNGFFDFYPVKEVKTSSTVVATFSDPRGRLKDGKDQPYIAVMPYGSGQHNVVWIASGEIWRLRKYREAYHERFWVKLLRYSASGSQSKQKARGDFRVPRVVAANRVIRFTGRFDGKDMNPLPQNQKVKVSIRPLAGDLKIPVVEMKASPVSPGAKYEGYFSGTFQIPVPGNYEMETTIPGTSDKVMKKFTIIESNPEMENPRPDFLELRRLASASKDVLDRVPEEVRTRLEGELERTNRPFNREGDHDTRLYFDLKSADVIPECMTRKPLPQISRGPVKDLWDWGFEFLNLPKISVALLLIVGLFSIEWLTRKLLKLA